MSPSSAPRCDRPRLVGSTGRHDPIPPDTWKAWPMVTLEIADEVFDRFTAEPTSPPPAPAACAGHALVTIRAVSEGMAWNPIQGMVVRWLERDGDRTERQRFVHAMSAWLIAQTAVARSVG